MKFERGGRRRKEWGGGGCRRFSEGKEEEGGGRPGHSRSIRYLRCGSHCRDQPPFSIFFFFLQDFLLQEGPPTFLSCSPPGLLVPLGSDLLLRFC
ncbi:unnamed protein product [Victoria cruziana]